MDKYIGRLLDNRYEILEVIGTGGMAVVYKARCHRLNRLVAIKILKDDYLEDQEFRRRFHAESQAVAMLGHANIVSIYDVSSSPDADADYIVMELIDGITLKQYMEKKGVLNWKETLHFAIQIAKALEHAHSRGIVHRDIKPHNIMVLKNGSVKVTDFGIARVMSKGNTLTKEALGSVHYISPEQAKGGRVDVRSDIYSLGVVMYEMMSGRPPYDGESPVAVAIQHINGGAVMPSTYNPNIPGGLEQLIMKAMAHESDGRFATATEMLADMDAFRKDPAMLFDYNTPPLDEVTRLPKPPLVLEPEGPKTTAEKVAQKAQPPKSRPASAGKKPVAKRRAAQETQKDHVATVAIIVCSLVAVIAIAIFLVGLSGGFGIREQMVEVPELRGDLFDEVVMPDGLQLKHQPEQDAYSEIYPVGTIICQQPEAGGKIAKGNTVFVGKSLGPPPSEAILMPNLIKMDRDKAYQQLQALSLDLEIIPKEVYDDHAPVGQVLETQPAVGEELTVGQKVTITFSKGQKVVKASVPNMEGSDVANATNLLKILGFGTPKITYVYSIQAEGEVIRQSVPSGTEVEVSTIIELEVSKGPEPTQPPTQMPTEPTQETPVTKTITIALPEGMTEEYVLTITHDGVVVHEVPITPDIISLEVELTGNGIQYYKINIPGQEPVIKEVDFTTA